MIDYPNITKKAVICGLCGLIMTTTLSCFVCTNPQCPEYMCEKHDHIPEKGDIGVLSYSFGSDASVGTISPSASAADEFPYTIDSYNEGGEY
jgi:hypothetical protein